MLQGGIDGGGLRPASSDYQSIPLQDVPPDVLCPVRCNGSHQSCLHINEPEHVVPLHAVLPAGHPVPVPQVLQLEPPRLESLLKLEALVGSSGDVARRRHLVVESPVDEGVGAGAQGVLSSHSLSHPLCLLGQPQHRRVCHLLIKVGVVHGVTSISQPHSTGVCTVLCNALLQRLEVAFGLGHGLVVEQQVAVGAHSSRLAAGEVRPDAGVRVQAEREVVLNQVLPAHPKVHRVPEVELAAAGGKHVAGDLTILRRWPIQEYVLPELGIDSLRGDGAGGGRRLAVDVAALKDVGHCVEGHVDGAVRQRLNQVLRVPRQAGAKAEGAGAGPLVQPVQGLLEGLARLIHRHRLQHLAGGGLPFGFTVLEVPLVCQGHHTVFARPGHHRLVRLGVGDGAALLDGLVPNQLLRLRHLDAGVVADGHDAGGEALEVHLRLGFRQLLGVVLVLDAHARAHHLRRQGAVPWDVDHRHRLERRNHGLEVQTVVLGLCFRSEILQSPPVVR
mmetsp:Transcript_13194/g.39937  ORF Transcript_13194/g.39937 Transcript_13194/m.39937 type:complete len:502 (-) Transcript_13194:1382-2887(-)